MDGLRTRLAAAGLASLLILGAACGDASDSAGGSSGDLSWSRDAELMTVEIVVDLLAARDGRIPVELTAMGGRPVQFGIQSAWSDGYTIHDLRFTDGEGREIPHREERRRFRIERPDGELVKVSYEMQVGGDGRHGNQGVVAEDHVLFDGRLFLLPQGAVPVGSARIRFVAPDDWVVGSPFREQGRWHYVDAFEPELTAAVLGATCIGVGRFEQIKRRVGEMEVRVASYAGWGDDHRQELADKTVRMVQYFHGTLGFDLRAPYSVVWVPRQNGKRVFGGSFANGTCFDHPTDRRRNWELLGHRIAHAMNDYRPSGMRLRDERDSWFAEGWASYMEATSVRGAGLMDHEPVWKGLHASFSRERERSPRFDLPLSREKQAEGEAREFLHYVKGPLAVKMLERLVIERSGRDLEQFMAQVWREYGWYQQPFPLREELERFTGESFEDFWALVVDSRGQLIPVWEEYLTPARLAAMGQLPAATVDREPISGDYLFFLARSGDFRTFGAIVEFLERAAQRGRELAARGIRLYPQSIRDHLFVLAPRDRYAVARLEAAYPASLLTGPSVAPRDLSAGRVRPNLEHEDGRIFAELLELELEGRGEARKIAGGRPWITAGAVGETGSERRRPALAFEERETIEVGVNRVGDARRVEFALFSGGEVQAVEEVDAAAESGGRVTFESSRRPGGSRVIVLRLDLGDGEPVTRAFWQRARPKRPVAQPGLTERPRRGGTEWTSER